MTDPYQTTSHDPIGEEKIAIIGIGCRLPGGANDHREYWENLINGKDCITPTPADRYDVATLGSRDKAKPGRLVGGRGGYIDGFDEFDPAFFGISPREAEYMDPQQRKLLEVAWEALEDGGQKPAELSGRDIGVFVGAFTLDYKILQFADLSFNTLAAHTATGTMMTMVSNRISYCFDFHGPSVSIDTACSSSLVAVHLACQSLYRGESELALAGGTLLHLAPQYTIAETKGGFLSPDGRSRTFDAGANGYVRAEGVGIVALKRLSDALRDGDPIHAVIIGSGVNQDGRTNGITVPNPDAQVSLIQRVCAEAGIVPGGLQYVEAHGTSTPVGDPLEAAALGRALSTGRAPGAKCYVGSVKTNIGHTEAAAGIAGLIKVALSLRNQMIPPHINLEQLNPAIDLASLPYEIPSAPTAWPEHDGPARAGVNAFGFGGTNAHVLLEQAPPLVEEVEERPASTLGGYQILPLTARDPAVLPALVEGIAGEVAGMDDDSAALTDLGYTLAHRRQHLESRLSVVYRDRAELSDLLATYLRGDNHPQLLVDRQRDPDQRRLVWVFTGMGPQWWAMGRQLFEREPVYREAVERCDREIRALTGWSLVEELNADEIDSNMAETWLAQPANFAVQIGLAALWRARGVRPDAIVGHSTGEIAAFYEAGVYTLADAVRVVVHRSRLQQKLVGTGTMLAVSLTEEQAERWVRPYPGRVSVAAVNSPTGITLAGDEDALTEIADALRAEQVFAKFLTVRVPYHSPRMDMIKDELLTSLADLQPRPAQVPLMLTGRDGFAHGPELDAAYWWDNVRDRVRFRSAIDHLVDEGYRLFVEIGPHPVLGHSIKECLDNRGVEGRSVPSIRRNEDEPRRFAMSLATLHNLGVEIDWTVSYPAGQTLRLPRYPWKRDRYWTEPAPVAQVRLGRFDHPLLGRRLANAEPTWQADLDTERLPYLVDHQIQGNVVFPAAGYLEMATQAVRALSSGGTAALADIELRRALFLPDGQTKTVQLSFSSDGAGFTIATAPDDTGEPVAHATGVIRVGQPRRSTVRLDAEAVRRRGQRTLDSADCYAALSEMGYEYGPAFQGISQVWIGQGEALALIRPPAVLADDAAGYHVHPVLLDACFQTLLTPQLLDRDATRPGGGIRLPLSIAEVRLDQIGDRPLLAHATITSDKDGELVGDIAVYTEDGVPLGRISGFRAADIERVSTAVGRSTIDSWLTELAWVDQPLDGDAEADGSVGGRWLILADDGGVGDQLAAAVTAGGGHSHVIRADQAEQLERLLAERFAVDAIGAAGLDTVVHLWNLDVPSIDDITAREFDRHNTVAAYSLIALSRWMQATPARRRLHIVTRGTQAVLPDEQVAPLGAPAWGIGRVLWYQELADQHGKLIDLDPAHDRGHAAADAEAILREVSVMDVDEIALRGAHRYTSRLRPAAGLAGPLPLRLRADGAYLVTGAFGALGRLLCRTLVRRGARQLILVGRSTLPERSGWDTVDPDSRAGQGIALVRELEALGAHPVIAALDITDEAALAAWLADYHHRQSPPIRGVFHLAGQVRDTLIGALDRDTFDAAYNPKVIGGYLLHQLLRDEPVEHFVLFASVASVLTTAGQTNYAAGNAFLDALAHHRRARGLPALSLDWGPWATGMIEELGLIDHYRNSRGMTSLAPEAGMAVLERVIGQDRAQLLVSTVVDWPTFLAWYPSPVPLVAELAADAASPQTTDTGGFLETFRTVDEQQRRVLLAERFTTVVAGVLRVSTEQVDPGTGLGALGLDSLLAMELRTRIQAELGVGLPVVALLGGTPVSELIGQLYDGLLELAADDHVDDDEQAAVVVYTDERQYPLTQNQQALWFLKQLNPDGFAYNIGGAVEVRVTLHPELMMAAFRTMLERHPILRANFLLEQGQPVQRVTDEIRPDVAVFDVRDRRWDDVYEMIIGEYRRPYDLEHDPLIRFRLFELGPDRWIIMKAVHHIISDAISTFTFIEELLAVYHGLVDGRPVTLPPVPARYLDFLNWQNRYLASGAARRSLRYWRNHLPEEVPVLNLPTDKPRPAVQTNNGASEFFVLDEDLSARVHATASAHGVTVFMVLMAAYYGLLNRYCGQDDVIVGSPVTGRTTDEFASVYGYFVNPLPLHVNLAGAPSVAELLNRVKNTVLGGLEHQDYPFVLLVDQLGLRHDPSRSAVFQAMFILLTHKVATEQYGYRLEYIELPEEEGQFDLTLSAYEDEAEHRFHLVLKYNTDLFESATVARLTSHYVNLLKALTNAPSGQPVSELDMLGTDERERVLAQWSGHDRRIDADLPVHQLFGAAAAERPDAIAVSMPGRPGEVAGGRRLRYDELDARSDRLAHRLRSLGVGADTVVGLCLDKSPELIVAVLAVLKAGGAYLPLDPGYPADRLSYMVRNAEATLVITDDAGRTGLGQPTDDPATRGYAVLTLDELTADTPTVDDGPFHPARVDMDSPAYLVYTSGSTGQPKAVRVSHGALASVYQAWRAEYRLDRDVRVHLQMASFSFDVFTGDLVRALCSGGTLVLVDRELLFDTGRLYQAMRDERVDCGEFVPAIARTLMSYCDREDQRLDFMRLMIVGSDAWKVEEYQRLSELCGPDTRVVNSYGLSEATIDSTYFEGPVDDLEPSQLVPIGRPFPNSELYILDEYGEPVAVGVAGELWIGGPQVALGYASDPEQTTHRFVTRTLRYGAVERPVRLYRTGDLARWDANGGVHLLGRADSQIKVRGHRIEIGEIESHLVGWPELAQAVVTVREDAGGEPVLTAYCVPATGVDFDRRELRRHLASYLPTHMIPSYLVELPELPLTPNGKVDVAALPAPAAEQGEGEYEPPVTDIEVRVAEHWQKLLGLERVGLNDDFFAVGGSSIKLIELIYHLQRTFEVNIPVSQLFKITTLHGMARTVLDLISGQATEDQPYLRFNAGDDRPTMHCFPPAGGHGLVYRQFAATLPGYEVIAFNYLSGDDKVARYADLVESTAADPAGGYLLLGYSLGGNLAFEVAGELERRGHRVRHVIIMDSYRITEQYELGAEHIAAFDRELAEHLRKHTGSEIVTAETREQAADYLRFSSRTPNDGVLDAPVTVISDQDKTARYASGEPGSWHGSSRTETIVHQGFGAHADMLDQGCVELNSTLTHEILTGGQVHVG